MLSDDHLLKTEEEWHGDVAVLRIKQKKLQGPFNARVKKLLGEGAQKIVADLSEVKHIDENALMGLLFATITADDRGGRMLTASVHPDILDRLQKMKIDPFPPPWLSASVEEAVDRLGVDG